MLNIAKFSGLIIITLPSAIIAYISVVKSHENRNTVPMTEIVKPVCYKQGRIYYTPRSQSTAIDTSQQGLLHSILVTVPKVHLSAFNELGKK